MTPRPALQAPCEECGGHGSTIDRHPMDPDQIETKCTACDDGLVDARCQICGGDEPAVEIIHCPGDIGPWLACEECVRVNGEVGAGDRGKIATFDLDIGMHTRGVILDYLEAVTGLDLATMQAVQS